MDPEREEDISHNETPSEESQDDFIPSPLCRRESKVPRIRKAVIVRDALFPEAIRILELVNGQYGNGDNYLDQVFGRKISKSDANECIIQYLKNENLDKQIFVRWSSKLACCASMAPRGSKSPHTHTLSLNSSVENFYLREKAIFSLADHEIGTHYVSSPIPVSCYYAL